jgi:membrane-associated phospholipid phosphatase
VAHSFVSALTCYRVHHKVGLVGTLCASLVAVSTLYPTQHYVLDILAGILLALAAYAVFLRTYPREATPELDRRLAPAFALLVIAIVAITFAAMGGYHRASGPVPRESR